MFQTREQKDRAIPAPVELVCALLFDLRDVCSCGIAWALLCLLLFIAQRSGQRARRPVEPVKIGQQLALQEGVDALLAGGISALEFPALVAELELVQVLALMQTRLESQLRARVLATGGCGARPGFVLRDELARLQRAVANGANPNRQLTIEDCAARLAAVVGPEVA